MKILTSSTAALIFLMSFNIPLHANVRMGIGGGLDRQIVIMDDNSSYFIMDSPAIYFPILLSPEYKLEPEFAFDSYKLTQENEYYYDETTKMRISSYRFGCGLFFLDEIEKLKIYYGLRFAMIKVRYFYESPYFYESDMKRTDTRVSPTIGGEYFLSDNFSLGGEARVDFYSIGKWSGSENDSDAKESYSNTNTTLFIRWYFRKSNEDEGN